MFNGGRYNRQLRKKVVGITANKLEGGRYNRQLKPFFYCKPLKIKRFLRTCKLLFFTSFNHIIYINLVVILVIGVVDKNKEV